MPVITLDPKTAHIAVDLQNGIVTLPTAHSVVEVVHNASVLAASFRRHGLPVVLVTVAGAPAGRTEQVRRARPTLAGWADLVPELNQQL
jgi:nicotinamidase-related amidase